ncbi:RNA methyltransferase [Lentisphaerota bacterium ZTH]|nr:RNA methyltransferase [Lentisphaerota bacterium]WET07194.1 RNA methyltransferase [Lentisphaerota bacterium ZTH]
MLKITSGQNARVKHAVKLRNRRAREKENLTLLEGYRELTRGREYGMKIREVFCSPQMFLGSNEMSLLNELETDGVPVMEVPDFLLEKMAYRDRPEGLIAVAEMRQHKLADLPVRPGGLYIVAEAVEKPGNLGSILRSADAAGVDGLIICNKCTDIYNPNVIRASTGALFSVPLAEAASEEAIEWLRKNNIKSLAATPHAEKIYTNVDMKQAIAIVVGTEQHGLTDVWLSKADINVCIPMLGKIDSLNVATAATILLYEAARQRDWKTC